MVDSVANLFLETLRDLLVEETKFLVSVKGEVEQVKRDLGSIHAMLMKADRVGRDSPTLNVYISQLRDLAFRAETLLETYAVEIEPKNEERKSKSLKEKLKRYICILCDYCSSVHGAGHEARDIISSLADLQMKLESEFGQQGLPCSSQQDDRRYLLRQTFAHQAEPHFVGMEKDVELIVSMVKDEKRSLRVIKIYGMGGLGKTTLARKVYNHPDVASYARAWVCVTQQFRAKDVLSTILRKLDDGTRVDGMGAIELVERIHSFLEQRKKCLIVIDDVWENDHWRIIKKAYPRSCNVVMTTRFENIGSLECHPYKLDLLTEDRGWELLQRIALSKDLAQGTDIKSLEDIGRQIVRKCGCLPLSISVIGGILCQKEEDRLVEWKKVYMTMSSYLRHGDSVEEYTSVKEVLELSYAALPYYLKPCFLYLACLSEDQEIETERLYLLWMAEGFVSYHDKGHDESLRDVAKRYLSELAMRSMVQVHKGEFYSPFDKFHSCRLHDLMYELCSSKVEKERFVKRIEVSKYPKDIPSSKRLAIPSSATGNSISRLAVINDLSNTRVRIPIEWLEEVKDLRSFMLLKKDRSWYGSSVNFEDNTLDFVMSQCLRILVIENCEFEGGKFPNKVDKLIHLRYLSLRHSSVRELPKFVSRGMPYLQTLDLRVSYSITLGNVIWKMTRLKHLFLPERIQVIGGEKLRLDGLNELETLEGIKSETACITDIPKLVSLRKLSVTVGDMNGMSTVLHHMTSNEGRSSFETRLVVEKCDLIDEGILMNMLMSPSLVSLAIRECKASFSFPSYQQGMGQNLVRLELYNCRVRGEDVNLDVMEELGKYPVLEFLLLHQVELGDAQTLIFPSNSFPQLKSLCLFWLYKLKRWEVRQGAMPKLTCLWIMDCKKLEKIPDALRFISTLQRQDIWHMPQEFIERLRRQDSATVSHIPFIRII